MHFADWVTTGLFLLTLLTAAASLLPPGKMTKHIPPIRIAIAALLSYVLYELLLQATHPGVNIRIDLLLIYPLIGTSVAVNWARLKSAPRRADQSTSIAEGKSNGGSAVSTSRLAIFSIVGSVLGLLLPTTFLGAVIGVVAGAGALLQIKVVRRERGTTLALAGILLGAVALGRDLWIETLIHSSTR